MRWDGTVVLADREHEDWSVVFDTKITYVGPASTAPESPDATGGYILPGLVDVHTHGGGGESFPDAETIEQVRVAACEHLSQGTTTMLASTVAASISVLEERARLLAQAADEGVIAGIHFEGPFLSEARCGAQDPRYLIPPNPRAMQSLMDAAGPWAKSMTLAPEYIDRESLDILVEAGAIPSWGHTDSNALDARKAIEMGLEVLGGRRRASVTHLFNGMKPLHHRDTGPIGEFLSAAARGVLVVEMICDGVHIDPLLIRSVVETVGRENCVFVTDAMAAAGLGDGVYSLGPQKVRVSDGIARLAEGDSIAGGTARLIDCVRVAVQKAHISLVDAVWMASTQGASMFGWNDRGRIEKGLRADLVRVDANLRPLDVVRGGVVVPTPA